MEGRLGRVPLFGWDGMAHAVELEGASYFPGGDEHGILKFSEGARRPESRRPGEIYS